MGDPLRWKPPPAMTASEMCLILKHTKPGDKLEIVIADMIPEGDLSKFEKSLDDILANDGQMFRIEDTAKSLFAAAAECGYWESTRMFVFEVLDGFSAEWFIGMAVDKGLIESISQI